MENSKEIYVNMKNIETLFDEVHSYFLENKKLTAISMKVKDKNKDEDTIIEKFKIEKNDKNLFENIDSIENLKNIKTEINTITKELLSDVKDIGQSINDKESESSKAIKAMFKSIRNFEKNINLLDKVIKEDISLDKNIDNMMDKVFKLVEDRIIKDCINPIYRGIKHTDDNIYYNVLICINNFLKDIGIYTINIEKSVKIDNDIIKIVYIQDVEKTDNYDLNETIKEIIQYPYAFDNEKIFDGKIISWGVE